MTAAKRTLILDQYGLEQLAEIVALKLRRGDTIALHGDLGAGKSTFARALIRACLDDAAAEVPSPTFTLVQAYATGRLVISHFDLYRLTVADEVDEIGLDSAIDAGAALIEWPERAGDRLPADRLDIRLLPGPDDRRRSVLLDGGASWRDRLSRILAIKIFLSAQPRWRQAQVRYLQGDASARAYARLALGERTSVLMDAPRMADGPPVRDGKPYSRIAHLAEDMRPFVAIGATLRATGLAAPQVLAEDLEAGLLLLEDLGDRVFGELVRNGHPQAPLWRAAVDVLVHLRRQAPPTDMRLPDGSHYALPRFDRGALEIELDLILDWYWPDTTGNPAPEALRAEMHALWAPLLDRLMALPPGWFLRDYHSPNLLWLPDRAGVQQVGVIDFQDALAEPWAYDLVSLLHDARVDVPRGLELELFEHYCQAVTAFDRGFDRGQFSFAYHAFGAQRRTRHIGLFVRLHRRDGKGQYRQHLPRAFEHLDRCLAHPELAALRAWYAATFPRSDQNR